MTKVIAIERGHDGMAVREVGEVFDVDLNDPRFKSSTWFAPADGAPEPKAESANPTPPGAGPKRGSRAKPEADGDLA